MKHIALFVRLVATKIWLLQKRLFRVLWLGWYVAIKLFRKIGKGFRRFVELRNQGLSFRKIILLAPASTKKLFSLARNEFNRLKKQAKGHRLRDKKGARNRVELVNRTYAFEHLKSEFNEAIATGDTGLASSLLVKTEAQYPQADLNPQSVAIARERLVEGNVLNDHLRELMQNSISGLHPNWDEIVKRNIRSAKLKRIVKKNPRRKQRNLLMVSHKHNSFMFLLPIIERLEMESNISLRTLDISVLHNPPVERENSEIPSYADELIDWADVIFVEWAHDVSSWFIDLVPSKKKIILRLHSYELLRPWPLLFNWGKIDHLICVSDHNLNRLQEVVQPEKFNCQTRVLPNVFEFSDYKKPKKQGVERTLGLVGYGSQNKRADLALDLLEHLLQFDNRWKLKLIGSPPTVSIEEDYFQKFFDRAAPHLERETMLIDPWSPDLPSWFQSVGIILSCSDREGTHESCREGIASGCVAAIRRWPWAMDYGGNDSLFPDSFIWDTTAEAAEYLQDLVSRLALPDQGRNEQEKFFQRESPEKLMAELVEMITS